MRIRILQKLIDKIRGKENYRSLFILPKLIKKFLTFNVKQHKINTIAIGSSHGEYGYRAHKNGMNLAISYQDLYYSYKIYEKINNKSIKNIILFYSVFSPGNQLIHTRDAYLAITFKLVFGITYQDEKYAKNIGLNKLEKKYKKNYKKLISEFVYSENYYGNEENYLSYFVNVPPEERTIPHYKNNQRNNNQTKYVKNMSELAKKYNQIVYIVIPPATENYKSLLPTSDILFSELYSTIKNLDNVRLINCYDMHFDNSEFVDWDHLNLKGAEKLTNIINAKVNETLILV